MTLHTILVGTGRQLPASYRDISGDPYRPSIEAAVLFSLDAHGIGGATLTWGKGVWEGDIEESLKIEVLDDGNLAQSVRAVALSLKRKLNQDAVLLLSTPVTAAFL